MGENYEGYSAHDKQTGEDVQGDLVSVPPHTSPAGYGTHDRHYTDPEFEMRHCLFFLAPSGVVGCGWSPGRLLIVRRLFRHLQDRAEGPVQSFHRRLSLAALGVAGFVRTWGDYTAKPDWRKGEMPQCGSRT